MDDLRDTLPDSIFENTLELLRALTAISSPSGDLAGLRRMAERLGAELAARGLTPEVRDEDGPDGPQPVLYARGAETARRHLLLIGHLDTVLPAAPPRLEGERLVATGAIDMKGGLATLAGALDLLRHRGQAPAPDLLLVAVPDEEVGGALSHAAIRRWGESARGLWVLEPGEPLEGDAETMVAGRRGMFNWRLEVRGQAAHSGLHFWDGRSALAAAARWCADAAALSRPDGGPTVNTGRLVAGDRSFVDDLAGGAALVGTERQLNVVPDRAVAEGEARFLRAAEAAGVAGALQGLAAEVAAATGTRIDFAAGPVIPPVDPHSPHRGWCERAVAFAADRGWRLQIEEERGGISFPNFLSDPSRIPVLDGLGPVGGGMHTRDEFVDLRSLRRRIVLLADLLAADAARGE